MNAIATDTTAGTLVLCLAGSGVVIGTLWVLEFLSRFNALAVRLIQSPREAKSPPVPPTHVPVSRSPEAGALPADSTGMDPHLYLVLAAAAAAFLDEEIDRVVVREVNLASPWHLQGRIEHHRTRMHGRGSHPACIGHDLET